MKHWSRTRQAEFWSHCILFGVPFAISVASSVWFWSLHSGSFLAGVVVVFVIEIIVLSVFILHLMNIHTTIAWTRHALPVLSSVGMYECFHALFAPHNSEVVTRLIATFLSLLLMVYLFFTKRGIERAANESALTPEGYLVREYREAQETWARTLVSRVSLVDEPLCLPRVAEYPAPVHVHEVVDEGMASESEKATHTRRCPHCGTDGLTMTKVMEHGRSFEKYGNCTWNK
jgi:hypothetical protein